MVTISKMGKPKHETHDGSSWTNSCNKSACLFITQVPFAHARELAMQTSPVLTALFNGMPVEKQVVPPKRKANKDAPGNVTKRLRKEAQGSRTKEIYEPKLDQRDMTKTSTHKYKKSLVI